MGNAFPSRLLRAPLPLRAGDVPQRPRLSIPLSRPRHTLRSRPGRSPQIEALQRCQAAFLYHLPVIAQALEATLPPQSPRLTSPTNSKPGAPAHEQRHCRRSFADAPPFHEALAVFRKPLSRVDDDMFWVTASFVSTNHEAAAMLSQEL